MALNDKFPKSFPHLNLSIANSYNHQSCGDLLGVNFDKKTKANISSHQYCVIQWMIRAFHTVCQKEKKCHSLRGSYMVNGNELEIAIFSSVQHIWLKSWIEKGTFNVTFIKILPFLVKSHIYREACMRQGREGKFRKL